MALTPWGINLDGYGFVINGLRNLLVKYDDDADVVWVVSANTEYAAYVEFGTSKMEAQPYMLPAARATARNLDVIAKRTDSLEELVEEAAKDIRDRAKDNAPVDTGRLRDSIKAERVK